MSCEQKEIMNELYDAPLYTIGAVAVSMTSRKAIGEPLAPENIKCTLKLSATVGVRAIGVKYMQSKKGLSADPFSQK